MVFQVSTLSDTVSLATRTNRTRISPPTSLPIHSIPYPRHNVVKLRSERLSSSMIANSDSSLLSTRNLVIHCYCLSTALKLDAILFRNIRRADSAKYIVTQSRSSNSTRKSYLSETRCRSLVHVEIALQDALLEVVRALLFLGWRHLRSWRWLHNRDALGTAVSRLATDRHSPRSSDGSPLGAATEVLGPVETLTGRAWRRGQH